MEVRQLGHVPLWNSTAAALPLSTPGANAGLSIAGLSKLSPLSACPEFNDWGRICSGCR